MRSILSHYLQKPRPLCPIKLQICGRLKQLPRTSKNSVGEVNDLRFLDEPIESFNEGQMRWIALYIIVSICSTRKLYHKCVCNSILSCISKISSEFSIFWETYLDAFGRIVFPTRR